MLIDRLLPSSTRVGDLHIGDNSDKIVGELSICPTNASSLTRFNTGMIIPPDKSIPPCRQRSQYGNRTHRWSFQNFIVDKFTSHSIPLHNARQCFGGCTGLERILSVVLVNNCLRNSGAEIIQHHINIFL